MHRKAVMLLAGVTIVLAACAQQKPANLGPAPEDLIAGMTFTVTRDFLIPSGDSSVYFQDTRLYPLGDVQNDDPVCQFSIPAATVAGQVITTRTLEVSNISYSESGVGARGEDATVTQLDLRDKTGGETFALKCMLPTASHGARPVTRSEIQGALGDYMTLKLPH